MNSYSFLEVWLADFWVFRVLPANECVYQSEIVSLIHRMGPVLSAAVELWNAATVNQRLSWVFQELNLFFLYPEVRSPSLLRTLKEAAAVIQGK